MNMLRHVQFCRPCTVGSNDTVVQTAGHIALVRTGEVIACHQFIETILLRPCCRIISVNALKVCRIKDSLIYPVPDTCAKTCRRTFYYIPVFLHISQTGTLGMNIFTYEIRFRSVDMLTYEVNRRIHAGIDIGNIIECAVGTVSFVMNQTVVKGTDSLIGSSEVISYSTLIA